MSSISVINLRYAALIRNCDINIYLSILLYRYKALMSIVHAAVNCYPNVCFLVIMYQSHIDCASAERIVFRNASVSQI